MRYRYTRNVWIDRSALERMEWVGTSTQTPPADFPPGGKSPTKEKGMRTTRSLAIALIMLLSGSVALLIPGPVSADDAFLNKYGLDLTAQVGNTDKDYIRACNVTHGSAAVEAFWYGIDQKALTNGPFTLETKHQSLTGGPFRRGECHNFYIDYQPSAGEKRCAWLDFVLFSGGSGNQTNTALICGEGTGFTGTDAHESIISNLIMYLLLD